MAAGLHHAARETRAPAITGRGRAMLVRFPPHAANCELRSIRCEYPRRSCPSHPQRKSMPQPARPRMPGPAGQAVRSRRPDPPKERRPKCCRNLANARLRATAGFRPTESGRAEPSNPAIPEYTGVLRFRSSRFAGYGRFAFDKPLAAFLDHLHEFIGSSVDEGIGPRGRNPCRPPGGAPYRIIAKHEYGEG